MKNIRIRIKNIKPSLLCILILSVYSISLSANEQVYRIPSFVDGVKQPVQSLNGAWQFRFTSSGKWETVQVPGELAMQGYAIQHDIPYTYQKTFNLPADYAGKRVILRFDGVYNHARLTINGKFVREHYGGFTRWETDVTDFLKAGKKNEIQVEITDRSDDISYGSRYAHHPIGGILRDVTIFVLPQTHLLDFYVETLIDSLYQHAQLKIAYTAINGDNDTEIVYSLFDNAGVKTTESFAIKQSGDKIDILDVKAPLKWNAEHPNLYTLNVSLQKKGKQISQFTCKVGFREIKVVGNQMFVNGMPVKLRGANRHDIHPLLGRTSTAEMDSLDALLFKESNMNFVRTSHYPPSEKFLDFCNRYGLYVECETAVCFMSPSRSTSSNDPAFAERYLSQFREMVKSLRLHPSIVIWSLGNESTYGDNFRLCWDWIKKTDTTRPVIFSYPHTIKEDEKKIYDILSMHYPYVDGNSVRTPPYGLQYTVHFQWNGGAPALFDEWVHVPSYTYRTLQEDPNIREFWGVTLDKMWSNLFESPGGLGGAIWCYVDEIFMLPEPRHGTVWWKDYALAERTLRGNCVGYGEWGIVDVWRRKKPEFWSTKKAYSPVRLLNDKVTDFTSGQRIILPVHNRFDHTCLDEIKAYAIYKGVRKEIKLPALEPRRKGMLEIAGDQWENGEKLAVEFFTKDNQLIDKYLITLGQEKIDLPRTVFQGGLKIEESSEYVIVKGNGFEVPFCKETGLICNAKSGDQVLIEKGPFLNLDIHHPDLRPGAYIRNRDRIYVSLDADWRKTSFSYRQKEAQVWVSITGTYRDVHIDIQVDIAPEGKITFDYAVSGEPYGLIRESGLKFYLANAIEHLQWKRKGHWNYYPDNDFAGNEGEAPFYSNQQAPYGKKPTQAWQLDTHNYFYWADAGAGSSKPLTQVAKGMKTNVYAYTLTTKDKRGLSVASANASVSCRTDRLPDEQLTLFANNRWDYPDMSWGNYTKNVKSFPCYGRITIILL